MTNWGLLPGRNELKQVKSRTPSNTWDTAGTQWVAFHLQLLFSSREDGGFGELALMGTFLLSSIKKVSLKDPKPPSSQSIDAMYGRNRPWQHSFIYSWNSGHLHSGACPERCWRWEAFGMPSPQEGPLPLGERNNARLHFLLPVLQTFKKLYCKNFANS